MARVDLKCGCGYKFFVGEAQLKTGVECPSCGDPVAAPGAAPAARKPAAPTAAPKPAAKPVPKPVPEPEPVEDFDSLPAAGGPSKTKLYIIGGAVTAFVVVVVAVVLVIALQPKVDYNKQAQLENERRRKMFEEISNSKAGGKTLALPAPAPTPAPGPKAPRSSEYKPMPAPAPLKPVPPPPTPAAGTPSTPATPGKVVALSPEVLQRIRAEVLTLHPFYLSLVVTPAEKARLDSLGVAGKGLSEDADFLQAILMGGKLKSARDEISMVAQTLPTLERESDENLPVDKVTLSDGRSLNCKIIEEGPDVIKVSRTLSGGVGGQMPLRRDNISRIEKGKGIGTEFATQWQAARKGSLAAMIELLLWCKSNNLTGQGKLVAFTILKGDPSNPQARAEAGLPTDPVKQSEDVSRGGMITYQGKSWAAKELRDKLLSDGYCILEGRWYSKKEKMVTVPGLFRYERQNDKPVLIGGLPLAHESETTYKATLEAGVGQSGEVPETKLLRRFYSPEMKVALTGRIPANITMPPTTAEQDIRVHVDEGTPPAGTQMTGEVTIHVPVGVPILEASVITVAEVKAGGSITVYHVSGSGDNARRTKLYLCDPKESQSRAIPNELVRGATEVSLVAVIEQQAAYTTKIERRHVRNLVMKGKFIQSPAMDIIHHKLIPDYKAVLFPSNNNTVEVFRLRLALAEPMPHVDKLFASNLDVLK